MREIKIPKIAGFFMLLALIYGIGQLFSFSYVLGKAGLLEPDIKEQLSIYSTISLFGIGMLAIYLANYFWKQDDKYGNNIGIYNKEETVFKNFTYPQITWLSIIFFVGIFLLLKFLDLLKKGFTGLKVLPQQFSPTDSLIVSTAQIPVSENMMAAFAIGLVCLIITFISVKYEVSKESHTLYKIFAVVIALMLLGVIWHSTVYPGSDIAKVTVAGFWGLGAFLSLATGSFIPFLVMHATNNFFIDFGRLYTSDIAFGMIVGVWVLILFIYGYYYRGRWLPFGRK